MHDLHKFLTVAESLGGSGIVVSRGTDGGGGVAISAPKEMSPSPSSCGMAPIRSASALLCPLVGSTGCGHFRFRLAGGPRAARCSDHILPGSGARAPHRSLGCRQRRLCGLAVGGRNCCLLRLISQQIPKKDNFTIYKHKLLLLL